MSDEAFRKHLEQASKLVASWPAWKRGILGGGGVSEEQKVCKGSRLWMLRYDTPGSYEVWDKATGAKKLVSTRRNKKRYVIAKTMQDAMNTLMRVEPEARLWAASHDYECDEVLIADSCWEVVE